MPKLAKSFHKPRVDAYQIAIDAVEREWERPDLPFEKDNELRFVLKKLQREQRQFIEKFNVDTSDLPGPTK